MGARETLPESGSGWLQNRGCEWFSRLDLKSCWCTGSVRLELARLVCVLITQRHQEYTVG